MSKLRGIQRGRAFKRAVLDLVGEFDEQGKAAGLSARQIDAHVAATFIELLCLMVEKRETYSAATLLDVLKEELNEDVA